MARHPKGPSLCLYFRLNELEDHQSLIAAAKRFRIKPSELVRRLTRIALPLVDKDPSLLVR